MSIVTVMMTLRALEAYKVRDLIHAHGSGIATWADWWGFKMEAVDGIPHNAALVKSTGAPVAIHSDSSNEVQRLNIQASKTLRYGMTEADALETITLDPARILGISDRVGSIEVGKDADFALFSGPPLDVYSLVLATWIDGEQVYDRKTEGTPNARP